MEVEAVLSKKLIGLKIGEEFDASMVGLDGYQLRITGGSDKNGFPMKRDVDGPRRIRSLLTGGVGFRSTRKGQRRRKTVRGNTLSDDIVQVNTIVVKKGKKSLTDLLEGNEE
jgi:small subunit ribosomal protein S6e